MHMRSCRGARSIAGNFALHLVLLRRKTLMVRRRPCAVSNHEGHVAYFRASPFETACLRKPLRMTFTRTTVSPVILRRERKRASKGDGPPLVPRILRDACSRKLLRMTPRDGREAASSG